MQERLHFASKKTAIFLSACAGLGIGFFSHAFIAHHPALQEKCTTRYHFVNPEPDCETLETTISRLNKVEENVRTAVETALKDGKARRISVFSRDLRTLRYVSVNDFEPFEPASLMKIPLLVAYHQYAELDPNLFDHRIRHEGGEDLNRQQEMQAFDERSSLVAGEEYAIGNLLERMIKYSDNNATVHLRNAIDDEYLERVLMELGIRIQKQDLTGNRDFATTRSFASIFRTLYNSSYLSRESSERVLELFSETTFAEGMRAVVPKDVRVLEKYGERSVKDETGKILHRELHECGIVYAKTGPFSFCIFTEGAAFDDLTDVLQDLSKELYEGMGSRQ